MSRRARKQRSNRLFAINHVGIALYKNIPAGSSWLDAQVLLLLLLLPRC
jgi:hypothetical protein